MTKTTYHIEQIAKIISGDLHVYSHENAIIDDLLIDSRKLVNTHQNLFIALKSSRNDGHKYILELIEKGVHNFVVSTLPEQSETLSANFILVKDTLIALQTISAHHRKQFDIPVIGITGSNGKTIVKEWLYQCLQKNYKICRSPKSYNSQIGVPLSVFQLSSNDQLGIFEAGISEPDEMNNLEKIIKPNIGIFINIGEAHRQNFVDLRQKVNEKLKLFVKSDTLIFCRDYGSIAEKIYNLDFFKEKNLLDWSRKNKEAKLYISNVKSINHRTVIDAVWQNSARQITIPFTDEASIENAIHVWLCLLFLGIEQKSISEKMKHLSPIAMRMELKEGINHCSIINDSYNSDLNSLVIAIDFLLQQQQHEKRTLILSDILQSGKDSNELYGEIASIIRQKNISHFIGIGAELKAHQQLFAADAHFFDTTQDFLNYYPFSAFNNETILLKGARNFEFERINKALGKKMHQTRLEVNLNALLDNYNHYRSLVKPSTRIMLMVKAFSYGSGSFEVANLLQFHQANYLAVAYADEGLDLRKAGIGLPIMVMNPELEALEPIVINQLEPEIYNFKILEELVNVLNTEAFPDNKPIGIHLKIDTGMHRLGFEETSINKLIDLIQSCPKIEVRSVFSHLAGSDNPELDYFTKEQLQQFEQISQQIIQSFPYPILRHISNSAAITRFPEAQYDMVRLGIGLYGVASDTNLQAELKTVSQLKTIISQIKRISKGESVGYNRAFVADRDMQIATIPIGYADGYSRRFSQGVGQVMIHDHLLPIIGNVCMDMCMIDLQEIEAQEGDEVIIFGERPSIIDLAKSIGTIPYELFTSISQRVKRIYVQE